MKIWNVWPTNNNTNPWHQPSPLGTVADLQCSIGWSRYWDGKHTESARFVTIACCSSGLFFASSAAVGRNRRKLTLRNDRGTTWPTWNAFEAMLGPLVRLGCGTGIHITEEVLVFYLVVGSDAANSDQNGFMSRDIVQMPSLFLCEEDGENRIWRLQTPKLSYAVDRRISTRMMIPLLWCEASAGGKHFFVFHSAHFMNWATPDSNSHPPF